MINEGHGSWRPWWIGQRMTCRECARVVELEAHDDERPNWMPTDSDGVTIVCERCRANVHLERADLALPPDEPAGGGERA